MKLPEQLDPSRDGAGRTEIALPAPPPVPGGISAGEKRRIFLVEDHPVFRKGLRHLIAEQDDLEVCGEAETVAEAMSSIEHMQPDLAIVDVMLRGANGLELLKSMRVQTPHIHALVLSMHDESLFAERALRAGAKGYLMKSEPPETVIAAMRKVLAGEIYLSTHMNAQMLRRFVDGPAQTPVSPVQALSDRELEVMQLIGRGFSTRQIAAQLHLSVKTIESHRSHLKEKLNIKSAPQMVRFAVEWAHEQAAAG